ncbi:MAG TPA: DoxX family protein [Polyangiaceae bacterium]
MTSETSQVVSAAPKNWMVWTGRVLSALPVLMLLLSASMKLSQNPQFVEGFTGKYGYPGGALVPIGIVEVLCAILYAIPRTSVLGAILVTGYLGGAVATHVRAGEAFLIPVLLGVFAWGGLYLRDALLRTRLPLRETT